MANVLNTLQTGVHGSRPTSGQAYGSLYACSTHSLIYQTTDDGTTWVTWATLGTATTLATDTLWDAAGDTVIGSGANTAARRKNAEGQTVAPTVNEDSGDGYAVGSYWYDTTADLAYVCLDATVGAAVWRLITLVNYSDWTPALTAATTNPTLGTGGSITGRYTQSGKHVVADGRALFGTSGTNAGSGVYYISLPVTATSTAARTLGYGYLYDDSTGTFRVCMYFYESTTVVRIVNENVAGSLLVTHAAPWAWAANDYISFHFDYEAA